MDRDEVKKQVDDLMKQYADEEIDGKTYAKKILELSKNANSEGSED